VEDEQGLAIIDKTGTIIFRVDYDTYFNYFFDGLLLSNKQGKYGYYNIQGKIAIPFIYELAWLFSDGYALIRVDNKYGYINKKGEVVISPQFEDACSFSDGAAAVLKDGKWGYIDTSGNFIIPPRFDPIHW